MNALSADNQCGMVRAGEIVLPPNRNGRANLLDSPCDIAAFEFNDYVRNLGMSNDIIGANAGGNHAAIHLYNPNLDAPFCGIAKACAPVVLSDDGPFSGIFLNVTWELTLQIRYPAAG